MNKSYIKERRKLPIKFGFKAKKQMSDFKYDSNGFKLPPPLGYAQSNPVYNKSNTDRDLNDILSEIKKQKEINRDKLMNKDFTAVHVTPSIIRASPMYFAAKGIKQYNRY